MEKKKVVSAAASKHVRSVSDILYASGSRNGSQSGHKRILRYVHIVSDLTVSRKVKPFSYAESGISRKGLCRLEFRPPQLLAS